MNVNFEAMKKEILEILEEGKKYGYNNEAIANELLNLHIVSCCFMVHNKGIPMSYHKTEKGAKKKVKEWLDSGIESAKTVDYHKLDILQ